jgi:hypothetical protein
MSTNNRTRRLVRATFITGLLSASHLLAAVDAAAAAPGNCYGAATASSPRVSVVVKGATVTATVTVGNQVTGDGILTVSPQGVLRGLTFSDGSSETVSFPSGAGDAMQTVTASVPPSDDGCVLGGTDSTTYDPAQGLGPEVTAGTGVGLNRTATAVALGADASTPASSSIGALGGTGTDLSTELMALLGFGLAGAGTISVVVNRRRSRSL